MAKDYKHHGVGKNGRKGRPTKRESSPLGIVRWMLITGLLIAFAVFLVWLKSPGFPQQAAQLADAPAEKNVETAHNKATEQATKPVAPPPPHFDFYTILPKKEVIVKDYEVKTRAREEQVGKNKKTNYILQAGSYKDYDEADQMKAKLALMGIESKIHKAKVESVTWYRVKIGPYSQLESVNSTMSRLQLNGIKPVVTELEN